jgi:HEAT repeat protein
MPVNGRDNRQTAQGETSIVASNDPETSKAWMRLLKSDDLKDRLLAIQALGEIGDEAALWALSERMVPVNEELSALVVAVGNLKRKLGVKYPSA